MRFRMPGFISLLLSGWLMVTTAHAADYVETPMMLIGSLYPVPAVLTLPDAATPAPAVVMLHGTASDKNEVGNLYQRLARSLAERGIASLRIDFAGGGESPVSYRLYTLSSAVADSEAALAYLADLDGIDDGRLALVGFSQGGLIAQLVAQRNPEIKAMALWSSVAGNGRGNFSALFEKYYDEAVKNGFARVHFAWRPPLEFSQQWFDEVEANTSLSDMISYRGALLAVAGRGDTSVPYQASEKLLQAAGSQDKTLRILDGANHIFNVLDANGLAEDQQLPDTLLTLTSDWLEDRLSSVSH